MRLNRAGTEEIGRGSNVQEVDNGLADLEYGLALVFQDYVLTPGTRALENAADGLL